MTTHNLSLFGQTFPIGRIQISTLTICSFNTHIITNFRVQFSPHRPRIQLDNEEFSLYAALVPHRLQCHYCPPTVLREDNVFSLVYLSFCLSTGISPYGLPVGATYPIGMLVYKSLYCEHNVLNSFEGTVSFFTITVAFGEQSMDSSEQGRLL